MNNKELLLRKQACDLIIKSARSYKRYLFALEHPFWSVFPFPTMDTWVLMNHSRDLRIIEEENKLLKLFDEEVSERMFFERYDDFR